MSTTDLERARAEGDAQRRSRYDAHREEKRAVGARARAEARLQAAFEADALPLHALEAKLVAVNKARTSTEIDAVLADVPQLDEVATTEARSTALVADAPRSGWAVALFGGTKRSGRWRVPRRLQAISALGGVELDFTRAELGPETDVHCFAFMGGIEIRVPPGVRVEGNGIGILGGFEQVDGGAPDRSAPVLRIHGLAIMGGVEIKTVES